MSEAEGHACPSSTLEHGTHLIGVVDGEGRVRYVSPALPLHDEFREDVRAVGNPEGRFRFSGPCVESGCSQWTGSRCGVIDSLLDQVDVELDTVLRPCGIRRSCRWFDQSGAAACRVCPLVVTDSRAAAPA